MFNINFNSNLLIGIIIMATGAVLLYNFLHGRKGDRFKGKMPLIIFSVLLIIVGLILFIFGWLYVV